MLRSLTTTGNSRLEIHGYTDNVGNPDSNKVLSENRANAVKNYLQSQAIGNFPNDRFTTVVGHGQEDALVTNDTAAHRAMNRRVRIVILANE